MQGWGVRESKREGRERQKERKGERKEGGRDRDKDRKREKQTVSPDAQKTVFLAMAILRCMEAPQASGSPLLHFLHSGSIGDEERRLCHSLSLLPTSLVLQNDEEIIISLVQDPWPVTGLS